VANHASPKREAGRGRAKSLEQVRTFGVGYYLATTARDYRGQRAEFGVAKEADLGSLIAFSTLGRPVSKHGGDGVEIPVPQPPATLPSQKHPEPTVIVSLQC
jgi:hypothetical protein